MAEDADAVFDLVGLTEYESTALKELIALGRTTAPNLAEAAGVPKARIYGVLDALADRGFVKVIPGRPKQYQPKAPDDILDRAVANRRQDFEDFAADIDAHREAFLDVYRPQFERAGEDISPTADLFHVVDVGTPSERETRHVYEEADETVRVLSKSFEYFESVRPAFEDALARGVDVSILLLAPDRLSEENRAIQRDTVADIVESYPDVGLRYSQDQLPWRGTLADPSMEYDTGTAIMLVQEDDVPNHLRQAAITENEAFVAGLKRYFDLLWEYESEPPGSDHAPSSTSA